MKKAFFFLLLIVLSGIAYAEFCSIDNSEACEIKEGAVVLNPLEADKFISAAENKVCIIYFYSTSCQHCANIKPLIDELEEKYSDSVRLTRYDVSTPENIALYNKLCSMRGYDGKKIPLIGINDRILVGEDEISGGLEEEIVRGIAMDEKLCPLDDESCHLDGGSSDGAADTLIPGLEDLSGKSIYPIIFFAGLTDGVNPCAFVILIFVMVFLQQISGSRKRLLKVTLTYIITILLTNIILGLIYFNLSMKIGFPNFIRWLVIGISIAAGLVNLKDFFWYGKGYSLGIPKSAKSFLTSQINKASVPAAFVLGSSVAVLEAPCSVPIYLAVIEVLKGEGNTVAQIFPYILTYNLMFILPLVVLSVAVYFGYSAKLFEEKSIKAKRYMKLAIGLLLLLLAALLILGYL